MNLMRGDKKTTRQKHDIMSEGGGFLKTLE